MASVTTAAMPPPLSQQQQQQQQQQSSGYPTYQPDGQQSMQPPPTVKPPPLQEQEQSNNITSTNIPHFQPYLDPVQSSPDVDIKSSSGVYNNDPYAGQQTSDDTPFTAFATADSSAVRRINMKYQLFLDQITPHWKARWTFSLAALSIFMTRVIVGHGWYVICYALGIYYLQLFISFISPKIDPSLNFSEDEDGPMLPTHASDEFKPFVRRLPEFKFWLAATHATLISLFLSLFELFDIPVFWPILLLYFIILTALTMRQQIRHMIKWKYVPWNAGKKQYTGKGSDGSNFDPTTV